MTKKIQDSPVTYSIIFTILITVCWVVITQLARNLANELVVFAIVFAMLVGFTILGAYLIGKINKTNGLKFTFRTAGFTKGVVALLPAIAFLTLNVVLNANAFNISLNIFIEAAAAIMGIMLFRGLLVTALFVKRSSTEGERIKTIFKAAGLYFIIYIPLNMLGADGIGPMQLVNTFIMSAGFCAAYMYSKNLLSLTIVMAVWQIFGVVFSYGGGNEIEPTPLLVVGLFAMLITTAIFAVWFSKRAQPFVVD